MFYQGKHVRHGRYVPKHSANRTHARRSSSAKLGLGALGLTVLTVAILFGLAALAMALSIAATNVSERGDGTTYLQGETISYNVSFTSPRAIVGGTPRETSSTITGAFTRPDGVAVNVCTDLVTAGGNRYVFTVAGMKVYDASDVQIDYGYPEFPDWDPDFASPGLEYTADVADIGPDGYVTAYFSASGESRWMVGSTQQKGPSASGVVPTVNEVINPDTNVTMTSSATQVIAGDQVTLHVEEYNAEGSPALTPAWVDFFDGTTHTQLDSSTVGWSATGGTGDNTDAILDPGETWKWDVTVTVDADMTFSATGHGLFPLGDDPVVWWDVTAATEPGGDATEVFTDETEYAEVLVTVKQEGATRTIGFWQTHTMYTTHVFTDHLGGKMDLGWTTLGKVGDVFGVLWSTPAKTSTNVKRCSLNQAKIICSTQLVGAILNSGLDYHAEVPEYKQTGMDLIEAAREALKGTDKALILELASLLDGYNNSYDDVMLKDDTPPAGYDPFWGSATPKESKKQAIWTEPDKLGACS